MKVLGLIALAHRAAFDEVPHQTCCLWVEEGGAEAVQCLLDALMARAVRCAEQLWPQR
jgi:hypothetical protein